MTNPKARVPSEADEQKALFEWRDWAKGKLPELALMFHPANGGKRRAFEAMNLKREGVTPGVPDIVLPVPRRGYGGLYIELKRKKGGQVSEAQREYLAMLNRYGNKAVVCKGWEQARDVILDYLVP